MTKEIQNRAITDMDLKTLEMAGVIPKSSDPAQVAVFARVCKEKSLSPFSKQIHLTRYNTREGEKYTIIVGIDGYRSLAARTGLHAGTDDVRFNLTSDGKYTTAVNLLAAKQLPHTATVTIYKIVGGQRVAFTHTAVFTEFSTGQQKWQTMPFQMIQKVAEAFALKKGFPDELSGVHIEEEIGAFEDKQMTAPKPPQKKEVVPLKPEHEELFQTTMDMLTPMNYAETMRYWADFKTTEYGKIDGFVELFFKKISSVALTVTELSDFLAEAKEWYSNESLRAILSKRKSEIENGKAN